jgi:hypothetical protein
MTAQFRHRCMECSTVGLVKAINHLRNLAWPWFEPGSPKWHTGALSTTPQAHAHKHSQFKLIVVFSDSFSILQPKLILVREDRQCWWRLVHVPERKVSFFTSFPEANLIITYELLM